MYKVTFHKNWPDYFNKLEPAIMERTTKKIQNIREYPRKRHLKFGSKYFVSEIGQYRIVYAVFEEKNEVRFFFIGNHKQYEKWYLNQ